MNLATIKHNHIVDLDLLPAEAIVVDAGACVGAFIESIRTVREKAKIYAIEPNADNFSVLEKLQNIVLSNKALAGDHMPDKVLFESSSSERGSIVGLYKGKQQEVGIIRINDILKEFGIQRVDYLKMDIEGAEFGVFADINDNIARSIGQLSIEIHGEKEPIINKLKEFGFFVKEYPHSEIYAVRNSDAR